MNKTVELSDKLYQEIIILKKGKDIARVPALVHLVLKYYKKKVIIFAKMKVKLLVLILIYHDSWST